MDYGALLRRTWDIVWNHKFLVVLGIIAVLAGTVGETRRFRNPGGFNFGNRPGENQNFNYNFEPFGTPAPGQDFVPPDFRGFMPAAVASAFLIPILCMLTAIGVALWAIGVIARGGLIAGVSALDGGGESSFSQAWSAGWHKGWRLIGIALLPLIPIIALVIIVAGLAAASIGTFSIVDMRSAIPARAGLMAALIPIVCVFGLAGVALELIHVFAERACMLEDTRVFESYSRGFAVLRDALGPAIVIALIRIGIGIGIGLILLSPGIAILLCCLWPLGILIRGSVTTYFSALWTLAWREWTGAPPAVEPAAPSEPAPAV